jgi:nucleoid-associated protein YgaU
VHNATTKQRHAALRRRLGIFLGGAPRWVREKRARLARLGEQAAAALTPPRATPVPASVLAGAGAAPSLEDATERVAARRGAAMSASRPSARVPSPAAASRERTTELFPAPAVRLAPSASFPAPAPGGRREPRVWHIALPLAVAVAAAVATGKLHGPAAQAEHVAPREAPPAPEAPAPAPATAAVVLATAAGSRSAPAAAPGAVVVVRGDTLWDLAGRHLGDARRWPHLHETNRALVRDPDLIYPGQELALPAR